MILFVEARFVPGTGWGLFPTNVGGMDYLAEKIPKGKELRADVTQSRNLAHHKLYWALCAAVAEAIDVTREEISDTLKLRTGHFELEAVEAEEGKWQTVARLKSIAFHKMDQIKFGEFFERCIRVVYERWYGLGHNSSKGLKARIDELLAPTTEKRG